MENVNQFIETQIKDNPVVLFMKGNKQSPKCGFSAQVCYVLSEQGVDFKDIDILEDWDLREGIKTYSNWPTIPQLYVKGQFVGGCDITLSLHRSGELAKILEPVKS